MNTDTTVESDSHNLAKGVKYTAAIVLLGVATTKGVAKLKSVLADRKAVKAAA